MEERKAVVLVSLTLISIASFIHGFLEIIPERAGIESINKKYIQSAYVSIQKTGRGGIYVANFGFATNNTFTNNLTMHLICYQFLHNEYRQSFIDVYLKICDMIEKEPFIGLAVRNAGVSCPIVPKEYHLHNLTLQVPEVQNMKWVFPFEKTKFRAIFQLTTTQETIGSGYMMLTIRQTQ